MDFGTARVVALGRKNFLHVGDEDAGANIAGLYSLVATCAANAKNPLAYLSDVLGRIRSHPSDRLDELLPQNWKPPEPPTTAASSGT
jgi:transposase